ncbi:MAG: hypothetical protein ACRDWN_02025, partial [Acidimicrobiales bacterium]
SAARRSLGRSLAGGDHLPRSHGFLRLAPSVGTDWGRFARLAGSSDPAGWAEAMSLVRGRPFEGLRSPDWAVLEGVAARIEDVVVQTALRLADARLVADQGHDAEVAVRQGLLVSPYDERLYRRLLEAADCQGNPAGVESAMAELLRLVGGDGSGTGPGAVATRPANRLLDLAAWVHPETARLYRALTRRRCRVGRGPLAADAEPAAAGSGAVPGW